MAGSRKVIDPLTGKYLFCDSEAGGCQGAFESGMGVSARLLNFRYKPGSLLDKVSEVFAGPHDFLRKITGSYDSIGNGIYYAPGSIAGYVDAIKNYALIPVAAPLAAAALVHISIYGIGY